MRCTHGSRWRVGLLGLFLATPAMGDTVTLEPVKDNTMYQNPAGNRSNGAGLFLFAGRNSAPMNSRRRGLVAFDVAGGVPPGSVVQSVELTMIASRNASGSTVVELHRLLRDWGEGASDAGDPGGAGAPAAPGDATWKHAFFDVDLWLSAGGDFAAAASAVQAINGLGPVAWTGTPDLVGDVQHWLDTPGENFGWMLLGDETVGGTAVRFSTREAAAGERPQLVITFAPEVQGVPSVSTWGLIVLTCLMLTAARLTFRRRSDGPALNQGRA